MAAGPLPLGIAAFAAIKFAGYTLAGRTLNRANHVTRPRPLAFGAARTLLGIVAGVSYATILARFGVHRSEVWYYVNLFPVRQLEWLLMLVLFYPRSDRRRYTCRGACMGHTGRLLDLLRAPRVAMGVGRSLRAAVALALVAVQASCSWTTYFLIANRSGQGIQFR